MSNINSSYANVQEQPSFADFYTSAPSKQYSNSAGRTCSAPQIKYYNDLCSQKGVEPLAQHNTWSIEKMSEQIGVLKGMQTQGALENTFNAPTEKQIKMISDISFRSKINIKTIDPNYESYDKKQTSALIEKLFKMEKEISRTREATDNQANKIVRMWLCPDVLFSDCGWKDSYTLYEGKRMLLTPNPKDIYDFVKANLTVQAAGEFIRTHQVAYANWAKTRVSAEQQAYIRTLEGRMADISSAPKQLQQSSDANGNVITPDNQHVTEKSSVAYNPLSDVQLFQLSKDEASKYIEMLTIDLADKEMIKFPQEAMNGDYIESKRINTDTEYEKIENFVYGCYAQLGEDLIPEDNQLLTTEFTYETIAQYKRLLAHMIENDVPINWIVDALNEVPNLNYAINA